MSEQPEEDREPPRLQDTTERSALPLPLPDGEEAAPVEEPAAVEAPDVADKAPAVDEPVLSPNGAEAATPPPFDPFAPSDAGPRPEVLIGAAFVGGLALALLIKRLGR